MWKFLRVSFFYAKNVVAAMEDAYLQVRFPFGTQDTMIEESFPVGWGNMLAKEKAAGAVTELVVSLATSGMVQLSSNKTGSEAMKTEMESRFKHLKEDTKLNAKNMVFKDRLVMNIVALGIEKKHVQIQVIGHVLNVVASTITPDGPRLSLDLWIFKNISYMMLRESPGIWKEGI